MGGPAATSVSTRSRSTFRTRFRDMTSTALRSTTSRDEGSLRWPRLKTRSCQYRSSNSNWLPTSRIACGSVPLSNKSAASRRLNGLRRSSETVAGADSISWVSSGAPSSPTCRSSSSVSRPTTRWRIRLNGVPTMGGMEPSGGVPLKMTGRSGLYRASYSRMDTTTFHSFVPSLTSRIRVLRAAPDASVRTASSASTSRKAGRVADQFARTSTTSWSSRSSSRMPPELSTGSCWAASTMTSRPSSRSISKSEYRTPDLPAPGSPTTRTGPVSAAARSSGTQGRWIRTRALPSRMDACSANSRVTPSL